jgi:hypothetical protein
MRKNLCRDKNIREPYICLSRDVVRGGATGTSAPMPEKLSIKNDVFSIFEHYSPRNCFPKMIFIRKVSPQIQNIYANLALHENPNRIISNPKIIPHKK